MVHGFGFGREPMRSIIYSRVYKNNGGKKWILEEMPKRGWQKWLKEYGSDKMKSEWERVRNSTPSDPGTFEALRRKKRLKTIMRRHPQGANASKMRKRTECFGFECRVCRKSMPNCHLYLVRWERTSSGKVRAKARYAQECPGDESGEAWCGQCSTLVKEDGGTRLECCSCAEFDVGRPPRTSPSSKERVYVDWEGKTSSYNEPSDSNRCV